MNRENTSSKKFWEFKNLSHWNILNVLNRNNNEKGETVPVVGYENQQQSTWGCPGNCEVVVQACWTWHVLSPCHAVVATGTGRWNCININ